MDGFEREKLFKPTDVYMSTPPSPPHVHVPHVGEREKIEISSTQVPDQSDMDEDMKALIDVRHVAFDKGHSWQYSMRRSAQEILPFLYLGPFAASKDLAFLRKEEITMLLVIRDTKSALARLLSGEKSATELGIVWAAVDVAGNQELIQAFPRAIEMINQHLVAVHRQQSVSDGSSTNGSTSPTSQSARKGKVLVFCESGNDRSASVVVAYLLAMYKLDLVRAIQFVTSQRFCVGLGDSLKNLLWSFHDLLKAQRDVKLANLQSESIISHLVNSDQLPPQSNKNKRNHDAFEEAVSQGEDMDIDAQGFEERRHFAPFVDNSGV